MYLGKVYQERLLEVNVFLLCLVLVCGQTEEGERHPWGIKMCSELCLRTQGCSGYWFSLLKLDCFLTNITSPNMQWFNRSERQADTIRSDRNMTCSTYSMMFESKISGTICLPVVHKNSSSTQTSLTKDFSCLRAREGNKVKKKCSRKLKMALESNNLKSVKNIWSRGLEDFNCDLYAGMTPVMWAASNGKTKLFDCLVALRCDLSFVDRNKVNVLQLACAGGYVDIVRKLIDNEKCDTEERGGPNHAPPVLFAAQSGHLQIVKLLVKKGCNLEVVDRRKYNILHTLCMGFSDNVAMLQYILSLEKISLDKRNSKGKTPVMMAVECNNKGVFELLVKKNCSLTNVDENGNNLLHLACKSRSVDIVKYLMRKSRWMKKKKNKQGRTPLQMGKCTSPWG